jgi:hypothetical protein
MPGRSATINLPYSTRVLVQAFVNAAWAQRFTITPAGSTPLVITGNGYFDTPAGSTVIDTPASGPSPLGSTVTIAIDHSADEGRTWQASQVDFAPCQLVFNNLVVVASDDSGADTWCAATVYLSWTKVPEDSTREPVIKPLAGAGYHGRA